MNKEDINIELIRDYFAGKLDAKAMHDLEKRALDDPFLAEAMEGYETNFNRSVEDMKELKTRLNERINIAGKKPLSLKPWLVAASVIILFGIGTLFFINKPQKTSQNITQEVVQNAAKDLPQKNTDTQQIATSNSPIDSKESSQNSELSSVKKDSLKSNQLAINKKSSTTINDKTINSLREREEVAIVSAAPTPQAITPNTSIPQSDIAQSSPITHMLAGRAQGITVNNNQIYRIVDSASGNPIVGASVNSQNNFGTVTDSHGYFHAPDTLNFADITALGYDKKSVDLDTKTFYLSPTKDNLNETVVVGYGWQRKKEIVGNAETADQRNTFAPSSEKKKAARLNNSNIRIRGTSALNQKDSPLIIIDGKAENLESVKVENIKNVTVLKPEQAMSLYGSKYKSGVILVTTKNKEASVVVSQKPTTKKEQSEPQIGWKKYNDYIQSSIKNRSTDTTKGSVVLRFTILPSGKLSDFKVLQGLNKERNKLAIDIMKDGPEWIYYPGSNTAIYIINFK